MNKIVFVCPFMLPVPAVKGGAIETLVTYLIDENEKNKNFVFKIYTTPTHQTISLSDKYKNTTFDFYNPTKIDQINYEYSVRFLHRLNLTIPNLYFNYLCKQIKHDNCDVIIVEANHMCAYYLAKKFPNKKVYLHIHSNDYENKSLFLQRVLEKVSNVIVVSDYLIKTAKKMGYNTSKMKTLKNCTDNKIFNKELYGSYSIELKNKYNIKENDFVIIYIGRLIEEKGVRELIQAVQMIPDYYNIKLLIVGSVNFGESNELTEYEKELKNLISTIEDRVIMTGYISNADLPKIHAIAHLQVVPSQWEEAAGLVVIEAMQSGVPVIVSDSGGIHEYINKEHCIEVKRGKDFCEKLAQQIIYLYENEEVRVNNANRSKEYAQRFSPERYYDNFCFLLEELNF